LYLSQKLDSVFFLKITQHTHTKYMIQYFTADYVIPVTSDPIKNGIVAIEDRKIIGIYKELDSSIKADVKSLSGVLIPGFINTHCHLELSHLFNVIPEKTGLVEFIGMVMESRGNDVTKIN